MNKAKCPRCDSDALDPGGDDLRYVVFRGVDLLSLTKTVPPRFSVIPGEARVCGACNLIFFEWSEEAQVWLQSHVKPE